MKKRIMLKIAAGLVLTATGASAQGRFDNIEIKTEKVAGGVYMLVGAGGSIGLSTGDDGAFVIDDQFAPLSKKIMAAIRDVTDKDVEFVLNTHFHGDHTGGDEAFGEAGAQIVAHENVRKRLKDGAASRNTPPAPKAALPVITIDTSLKFYWNGETIHVVHQDSSYAEGAHTDGDALVYFVDANVLHMGDVFFNGGYPFIDLEGGGDLDGYIATQEKALAMIDGDAKIIPGHGALAGTADLEATVAMLKDVRARVQALIDEGPDEDAAVAADPLKDLNGKWGQGFIDGENMVRTAYKSLTRA